MARLESRKPLSGAVDETAPVCAAGLGKARRRAELSMNGDHRLRVIIHNFRFLSRAGEHYFPPGCGQGPARLP